MIIHMKIEKLNENKIRIILNTDDLQEKKIDLHTFLSNSIESQRLFLEMLDEAEKEIGFVTDNYKIMIEALAISEGGFILTITRIIPDLEKIKPNPYKKKLRIRRRVPELDLQNSIYFFASFDLFCDFCKSLQKLNPNLILYIESFSKKVSLYLYEGKYYLLLSNVELIPEIQLSKKFCSAIVEFATFVSSSSVFERKLTEYGTKIMEKDALSTCVKYF